MKTTLTPELLAGFEQELQSTLPEIRSARTPVHTVYGGANLFTHKTIVKLGSLARSSMESYAADSGAFEKIFGIDASIAARVSERVREKLSSEAVEDFRIDFEDGYGVRSAENEDEDAVRTAAECAKAAQTNDLPAFWGIRIKALNAETGKRALRTLDLFLTSFVEAGGSVTDGFVVTIPKVSSPRETAVLADALAALERELEIPPISVEIMVETARSLVSPGGSFALAEIVNAARGRCVAAHFGAYDYLSELGIAASEQGLRHSACDLARSVMKLSLAGSPVDLADGATNLMPVARHRGEGLSDAQKEENTSSVHAAWRLHYDNIRHGLASGFYRGWDLHPGQFVARYAAVYAFFFESLPSAAERLRSFIEKGARANLVGNAFDDAATAQGLLGFFRRAVDCGAIAEDEVIALTGISIESIRTKSFVQIVSDV